MRNDASKVHVLSTAVLCLLLVSVCHARPASSASSSSSSSKMKGLAIDWGTEWVKMVLVAPAAQGSLRPTVEVVVDEQSERRTPALVAFDPPPAATGRLLVGNA